MSEIAGKGRSGDVAAIAGARGVKPWRAGAGVEREGGGGDGDESYRRTATVL